MARWCPVCVRPTEEHELERTVAVGPLGVDIIRRRLCPLEIKRVVTHRDGHDVAIWAVPKEEPC